jgi:hypothetical protein
MILAALFAAATIVAPPWTERTPNLFKVPDRCQDQPYRVVDRDGKVLPRKLAELPPGGVVLAVDRQIDGCRVTTVLWGNVKPDDPNAKTPSVTTQAVSTAIKREDAPSNRR